MLLLIGCASGTAREAERGRETHASEEVIMPEIQATYSAEFIDPGTPIASPTAEPPPPPTLERLVLTHSVTGNGPSDQLASVPANMGTLFAAAELNGLSRGIVVSALWRGERGNVFTSESTIEQDATQAWVGLPISLDGSLPPGTYAVFIQVWIGDDGPITLNSLVFEITPAGSQPVTLSPGRAPETSSNDDFSGNDGQNNNDNGGNSGSGQDFPNNTGDSPTIVPTGN